MIYVLMPFRYVRQYKTDGAAKQAACKYVIGRAANFECQVWRLTGRFQEAGDAGSVFIGKAAHMADGVGVRFFNKDAA